MKEKKEQQLNEEQAEKVQEEKGKPSELELALKSADEFKDKWMRSVAEFDNYKKRNAKVYQEAYSDGKADVIVKILPVGDNLDAAIGMGLDEKTTDGLKLLKKKFDEVLKGLEVEEINPVGEKFDPMTSEAIMQAEAENGEEPDTVKQVFQKGYKVRDKIIRYAKVSVIK
ncbi:MAG: nucleotide exchange factor GrpE [Clostridia bacterium]|nr:nucleotide exchange factor GrpE [Clostridia bacterium]